MENELREKTIQRIHVIQNQVYEGELLLTDTNREFIKRIAELVASEREKGYGEGSKFRTQTERNEGFEVGVMAMADKIREKTAPFKLGLVIDQVLSELLDKGVSNG